MGAKVCIGPSDTGYAERCFEVDFFGQAYDLLNKANATEAEFREAINTVQKYTELFERAICDGQPEEEADDPPDYRYGW